jgi:site-specific recombinase XerD
MQAPIDSLEALYSERLKLKEALLAENTQRGYHYDWDAFSQWCDRMHVLELPAQVETVSLYTTAVLASGRKVSTVARALSTIASIHRRHDLKSPVTEEVRQLLHAARRGRTETLRQARPLSLEDLRRVSEALRLDGSPIALRDRAILVIGFASALRSANLVALNLSDVEFCGRGLTLEIHREKTDQEGKGRLIGLPRGRHRDTCPVRPLRDWLRKRGSAPGALFTRIYKRTAGLNPERISQIVQAAVARAGLAGYSSHSLRSGFITEAGERTNLSDLAIAAHTGHKDMATLRGYFRHRNIWRAIPAAQIGL